MPFGARDYGGAPRDALLGRRAGSSGKFYAPAAEGPAAPTPARTRRRLDSRQAESRIRRRAHKCQRPHRVTMDPHRPEMIGPVRRRRQRRRPDFRTRDRCKNRAIESARRAEPPGLVAAPAAYRQKLQPKRLTWPPTPRRSTTATAIWRRPICAAAALFGKTRASRRIPFRTCICPQSGGAPSRKSLTTECGKNRSLAQTTWAASRGFHERKEGRPPRRARATPHPQRAESWARRDPTSVERRYPSFGQTSCRADPPTRPPSRAGQGRFCDEEVVGVRAGVATGVFTPGLVPEAIGRLGASSCDGLPARSTANLFETTDAHHGRRTGGRLPRADWGGKSYPGTANNHGGVSGSTLQSDCRHH